MVETRGSRRKSVAPEPALANSNNTAAPGDTSIPQDGNTAAAEDTIKYYRQKYKQQQEKEQRSAWTRLVSRLGLWWFQYEMSYGPYMLDRWERNLVLAFIVSLIAFTLYGLYNVGQRYLLL